MTWRTVTDATTGRGVRDPAFEVEVGVPMHRSRKVPSDASRALAALASALFMLALDVAPASSGAVIRAMPADFQLVGSAQQLGESIQLTNESDVAVAGAAWIGSRVRVGDGLDVRFDVRITPQHEIQTADDWAGFGDGLAFVVQADPRGLNALGSDGANLGYGDPRLGGGGEGRGITKSLAVEFDTAQNTPEQLPGGPDPSGNHVSVQTRGRLANSANHRFSLGATSDIPNLADGQFHTIRIRYMPNELSVFVDDMDTRRLTASVRLEDVIGSDSEAWIGVTAANGGGTENHDITRFSYALGGMPDTSTVQPTPPPHDSTPTLVVLLVVGCGLLAAAHVNSVTRASSRRSTR